MHYEEELMLADGAVYEEERQRREDALEVRSKLLTLDDQEFLELILMQPANLYEHPRVSLNGVIPKFPAGNIATKHRDNKLALTDKQKMALANVYISLHLHVRLSGYKK